MLARWEEKQKKGQEKLPFTRMEEASGDQDTDWDSSEEAEDEDVSMDDAPHLAAVARKEKPAPEIDDDGFTKVVGRKKH